MHIGESFEVGALDLDADGELVTALSSPETRRTRMPGLHGEGNELRDFTFAVYQQMTRNPQFRNLDEGWMGGRRQAIREQLLDAARTEFTGGQADIVNHEKIDFGSFS